MEQVESVGQGAPGLDSQSGREHRGRRAPREGSHRSPRKGHPPINSAPTQILVLHPSSDLSNLPLGAGTGKDTPASGKGQGCLCPQGPKRHLLLSQG